MNKNRRLFRAAPLAAVLVLALALPATGAPDAVPDRLPVASEPVGRGELLRERARSKAPTTKTVDGLIGDWKGRGSNLGGTWRYDAGEHIYTDYLFDDFGADDGDDAERLAILGPLREAESRTARIDQLFQAAGDQFDAPRPVGAPDHYGDGESTSTADLREVRWAAQGDQINLLARTTTLTDRRLEVTVLVDDDGEDGPERPVRDGLTTKRFERAIVLNHREGVTVYNLVSGTARRLTGAASVVVNPDGGINALEASLPADLLPVRARLAVAASRYDFRFFRRLENVAYRFNEPVAGVYNDQRQALALHAGNIDEFATTIDFRELRRGATHKVRPGGGYFERQFRSGANISREEGEHGRWQPYGLYVPSGFITDPPQRWPLTFWLHYRGGKAHSGAAWTPRLITQLGEETGNIVVTPRGRGTSTWYVSEAHQDFFEVFADVHGLLPIDAGRRYLSGYSMGGYGTYLFGLLYPDLFAAGYSTSGAPTQGAWTGEGPDDCRSGNCFVEANGGDANAQLTYRILENARHFPITIHHGTNDELVPITGIERIGARLLELGYRHDLTVFAGYEHFTQAIVDEWADGAQYLNRFWRNPNPRTITYKVVPALVNAVNTVTADGVAFSFKPDGAYWSDGLVVRDGDLADPSVSGTLDATSEAIEGEDHIAVPRAGAVSPLGHSTPFVRSGLDWWDAGSFKRRNAFTASLDNLSRAELNVRRMQLRTTRVITGTVTTDGPATLVLTAVDGPVEVIVDGTSLGRDGGRVRVPLTQGEHEVKLRPAR